MLDWMPRQAGIRQLRRARPKRKLKRHRATTQQSVGGIYDAVFKNLKKNFGS